MADEFDPLNPPDAAEAAYREALLDDDAGRERRRARLMAALPRPEAAAPVPVARTELAWRWQPYALGLLGAGLLVAAVLALKGRPAETGPGMDPRMAANQAASTPVVVAQAEPAAEPLPGPGPGVERPRAAAKVAPAKPRSLPPAPTVLADASSPILRSEAEMPAAPIAEPPRAEMAAPPAAPVMAAASPPPAPVAAAAPPKAAVAVAPSQADALARIEVTGSRIAARERPASQAAAGLAAPLASESVQVVEAANPVLLAAMGQADVATARSALQAGASVHQRDVQGRSLLMLAARSGSREMVDLLLAAGARKADRDPQGWTAADHALAQGHRELAAQLR